MKASMDRVQKLYMHPLFQEQTALLKEAEKERVFCRHTMEHFLDVARLMYIYDLEEGNRLDKELIYAAALLHDIGRCEQIFHGTPHHTAGAETAGVLLPACGFSPRETKQIQEAIVCHRSEELSRSSLLARYLFRADKQSRCCFCCPAAEQCNWPEEKKNNHIQY